MGTFSFGSYYPGDGVLYRLDPRVKLLGGIAFLANLMREIASFFCIPWIARHLNGYACIAAAAATSEDTTLPMMIRYTDERCVVYSLINGVICSALVPVLITLCVG